MPHPRICSDCGKLVQRSEPFSRTFCDTCYRRWRYHNVPGVKEQQIIAERCRKHQDINYRLSGNLRCRFWQVFKGNVKQGSAIRDLGCTLPELRLHLEAQFSDGMNWENYGSGWHIDHVVPLTNFDLSDRDHLRKASHYSNLQPLWKTDNLRKGAKLDFEQVNLTA